MTTTYTFLFGLLIGAVAALWVASGFVVVKMSP